MNDRQILKKSILLCEDGNGNNKKAFTIVRKISEEGASSVCYEAYPENSGRGVLKEFYPLDAYALERDAQGQLIHPEALSEARERFLRAEREYLEPYRMLLAMKQDDDDQQLAAFIPSFEIYHGCNDAGEVIGTSYIWTPEPKRETFEQICQEIHKHPTHQPEHKLVTVLTAMESLTKCVCALHCADIIHRDIKPSNFGFLKLGQETLTQTLSLFDINSICSVFGKTNGVMYTEGYAEPEARFEAASNQTDIYAIGATLFHAIVISDETKANGFLYRREYYDNLREMVDGSKLIRASEANAHPRLRNMLTTILRKCLCERTYRYANCESLLEDLKKALYYALPAEITQRRLSGEKWILADMEKSLDRHQEKNSLRTIQYHLYEHPLYQCVSKDEETLNVLVIGFGNYGQKFHDVCLQVGQMRNHKLQVTVVSDDETDKAIYLAERPELADFFNIDGSLAGRDDTYGNITFEVTKLERGNQAAIEKTIQDIMCEHDDDRRPHYIFIALGEDPLNESAAQACKAAAEVLEIDCVISYVREDQPTAEEESTTFLPLYVNADVKQSAMYADMERMVFNTHLVWEKNLNVDPKTIKDEFRKPYNYEACVASVIALKYKLYSMGIDLATTSFNEAARQVQTILDKGNRTFKDELIWIEHRRWVTEKLCLGWRSIQNLEECASGVTKDEKNKRHVCIRRSRPDQRLATELRINGRDDRWMMASDSDLNRLDELDRMSVELHRMYVQKAEMAREQNLLSGSSMDGIRALIEGHQKVVVAFQEWFACLKNIWQGDVRKVRLYKGLKQAFLSAAEALPGNRKKAVREQVKAFEAMFYPILASMEFRDWKQDDTAFIDHIPFVLTYTENAYMVIPYAIGDNTEIFGNVAALTVVNPIRILYLCLIEKAQDMQDLRESIPYVMEYMAKKHCKAAVEFVLTCTGDAFAIVSEDVEKELKCLSKGRIRQVKRIGLSSIEGVAEELESYLTQRSTGKEFFAVEKNATKLSYLLQGAGFHRAFPSYQFDSKRIAFHDLSGCDMLGYIRKMPYITVADMAAFRLSSSESNHQPEFFEDYENLWKTYCKRRSTWKLLCDILGKHAEKNDLLASFKKMTEEEKNKPQEYRYILPFSCSRTIARILQFLKDQKIIEQESHVNGYTTDSCEIVIVDQCGYQAEFDKLFANVYALMFPDAVTLHLNTKTHEVGVVFDQLVVSNLSIVGNRRDELVDLMKYFQEKGYVIHLITTTDDKISFTYATRQIKELLTTAGKMLEVYTYHKAKELARFDDVVSSFELNWQGTEVRSEFDCILTKGFRTLFVECKARSDIEQEFYFKLAGLADQFGINATAVLVADTREKPFYDHTPVNILQRKRGKMMHVVTIWKPEEIDDIGYTLLKIINGTYVSEEE